MKKAIILAAGRGTRMKSDSFKVMHEIGGRPMIAGIIDTLTQMQLDELAVVVSRDMAVVQKVVEPHRTFIQENALGTAHAALAAADMIAPFDGTCFVLFGDHPLFTKETLEKTQKACEDGCDVVVIGFEPDDAARYGRLIVDELGLEAIVEYKDATPEQRAIRLCNSGVMCVNGRHLLKLLQQVKNDNASGEFYLTDIVALAKKQGLKTGYILGDKEEVAGVNSRQELAAAEYVFQNRKRREMMANGVTLLDPATVYFSFDTQVEQDVVIEPCVFLGTGVYVEKGARIAAFSRIENKRVRGETQK